MMNATSFRHEHYNREGSQETTKVTCDEHTTRDFQALDPGEELEALDVTCGDEGFQHGQRLKRKKLWEDTMSLGDSGVTIPYPNKLSNKHDVTSETHHSGSTNSRNPKHVTKGHYAYKP